MTPRLRKLGLTAHIVCSVGWIGAVASSFVVAVVGLTSRDAQMVRAAYLMLEPIGRVVLLPLSLASLLTGLVLSFGTRWGLFRHYWVLMKLLMNVFATVVLLMYMQTLAYLAGEASDMTLSGGALLRLRNPSPVLHACAALLLLLVATVLAIYKPTGVTPYGLRKQNAQGAPAATATVHDT
jgi:hypothetical protein